MAALFGSSIPHELWLGWASVTPNLRQPKGKGRGSGESGTQEKHHFTSYERDAEGGTDYAVNRQYNQSVGRFNRVDPFSGSARTGAPQTWNRYSYTVNEPVNHTDPLGLELSPNYNPWDCSLWMGCNNSREGWIPTDGSGDGGNEVGPPKAPLEGKKLKKYTEERAKTQDKLKNSQKCRDFLSSHGIDPDKALDAVNQQRAYDGEASTIPAYSAGVYNYDDIAWDNSQAAHAAFAQIRNLFQSTNRQVGAITAIYPGGLPPSQTTLADRSDVYFSGNGIFASDILHEALHSLLGATDAELAAKLGVTLPANGSTQVISDALHDNDCGG